LSQICWRIELCMREIILRFEMKSNTPLEQGLYLLKVQLTKCVLFGCLWERSSFLGRIQITIYLVSVFVIFTICACCMLLTTMCFLILKVWPCTISCSSSHVVSIHLLLYGSKCISINSTENFSSWKQSFFYVSLCKNVSIFATSVVDDKTPFVVWPCKYSNV
jgi:hypothetical protein